MVSSRERAAVQRREVYARVPDGGSFRTNSPAGFLVDFAPIPQPGDASDIVGQQAAWWYGSDASTPGRTSGSPLTVPNRPGGDPRPAGSVLPSVTRCLSIIVEAVIRTRWIYRDSQGRTLPRPLWIDDPMLLGKAPGPIGPLQPAGRRVEGQAFFGTVLADAILWGRGAFTFIEAADGSPLPGSMMLLNPFMVDVPKDGRIVLDPWGEDPLRTDFDGRFELNGDTWRVVVMPGLYPNHHGWPQGVLLRHFDTFRVGARLVGYLDGMFTSGVPSGYLAVTTPSFGSQMLDDPDHPGTPIREDVLLKREWMNSHGSGKRSVAVLNASVAYTPIAVNPVDADVVNLLSASRTDVAHAFGMSSIWLDVGVSGMSYSNSSERRADLVSMTAAGWGERLTNLLSALMPYGTGCEVNWPSFIAPSVESLMPSLVQAVQAGILTAAEARAYLGVVPWDLPDPAFTDRSPAATEPQPVPAALAAPTEPPAIEGEETP